MPTTVSEIATVPPTIAQLPFFASGRYPKPDLIGQCSAGAVMYTSGRELLDRVRDLSLGLGSLGMTRGDRVILLSENRPEWLFADLAIQAAGAVTVPVYPTASIDQVSFILRDSDATMAIVSTRLMFEKLARAIQNVPQLRTVVVMDSSDRWSPGPSAFAQGATADSPEPGRRRLGPGISVLMFAEAAARGHECLVEAWGAGRAFHDEAKKVEPGDLATIIYTSGTTGEPKGVMLTHGNLTANIAGVLAVLDMNETDTGLSFLPLCHSFERMVAYCYLASGVSMVFAESFNTIGRDLARVRPTILTGVPRIYDKLHARVLAKGAAAPAPKRRVFSWAVGLAYKRARQMEAGAELSGWMRLQSSLADRLVFRHVREAIGGRLRFAVSGGAALNPEVGRFFYGAGIPILEGYGLTETAPVLTVMSLASVRFGAVGRPLPGVEMRVAPDGELLARGPNIMAGYHHRPDETAEVLRDGWFHTGDVGSIDADGYVRITDRKKEILVTSGGKNIAPQPIESAFRSDPLVAETVVIGERRPFLTVLIVPDVSELRNRLKLAPDVDAGSLPDRADVRSLYQHIVDSVNVSLAQHERIRRFALLPHEFSIDSGELTPTLKVKRRVIEDKYRDVIEKLYELGQ